MNCLVCAEEIHNMFYTSVDTHGNLDIYCYSCYQRAILDNYLGIVDGGGTKVNQVSCECGTKSPMGQGHSNWCMLYRKEFQ